MAVIGYFFQFFLISIMKQRFLDEFGFKFLLVTWVRFKNRFGILSVPYVQLPMETAQTADEAAG